MGETDNVQKQRAQPIAFPFSSPSPYHQGEGAQRADGGHDIQDVIKKNQLKYFEQ